MEEQLVAHSLQRSREQLRALLLPPQPGAQASYGWSGDIFPRSALMQFLLDEDKRRMLLGVLGTALMMFQRKGQQPGN